MTTISRKDYALMFGPTTGDKVRLGDSNLIAEVEYDYAIYGEEIKFGGGKSIRDGMAQKSGIGGYSEILGNHTQESLESINEDSSNFKNAKNLANALDSSKRAKNAKYTANEAISHSTKHIKSAKNAKTAQNAKSAQNEQTAQATLNAPNQNAKNTQSAPQAKTSQNTPNAQTTPNSDFRGIFERQIFQYDELDLVITNALVIDYTGIFKADIGIKNGLICGIGKAGNPHTQSGVGENPRQNPKQNLSQNPNENLSQHFQNLRPDSNQNPNQNLSQHSHQNLSQNLNQNLSQNLIVGASTEVIAGEGLILTAGGIDTHIHFIAPQQIHTALFSGITTMIGGGTGPAAGTNATTCTPGEFNLSIMLKAAQAYPMNLGFFGKGNSSNPAALEAQIKAGALGLKIHEDWGSTPSVINTALNVADMYDVQVAIHTDTLNESGFVEDTIKAINNRTIHTFHTEGAGGGHAPDIIKMAGLSNVLPASTNPTLPFTKNTLDEHLDMLMVCHHLDKRIKEDVAFADSRIRPESIAAEDVLHDRGIISITSSDSQAMGRVGEVITRTWQLAHKNKAEFGALKEERGENDNVRIKRYIAKYTINPAIASGISDYVGSVEVGKMADLVLWKPAFFGVKPEMIIKGGAIVGTKMGDINASIPTPEPVIYRESFGAHGGAKSLTSVIFTSKAAIDLGLGERLGLSKKLLAVKNCRNISKKDLPFNDVIADIVVNPQTYEVFINKEKISSGFASKLPLAQLYHLF